MPLIVVWYDQFCRVVTGHHKVKVAVIGRLLFCCYLRSIYCLLNHVGFFEVMHESFCKVHVIDR